MHVPMHIDPSYGYVIREIKRAAEKILHMCISLSQVMDKSILLNMFVYVLPLKIKVIV